MPALILYPYRFFYINNCITANLRTDPIYRVQFIARSSPTSCHPHSRASAAVWQLRPPTLLTQFVAPRLIAGALRRAARKLEPVLP